MPEILLLELKKRELENLLRKQREVLQSNVILMAVIRTHGDQRTSVFNTGVENDVNSAIVHDQLEVLLIFALLMVVEEDVVSRTVPNLRSVQLTFALLMEVGGDVNIQSARIVRKAQQAFVSSTEVGEDAELMVATNQLSEQLIIVWRVGEVAGAIIKAATNQQWDQLCFAKLMEEGEDVRIPMDVISLRKELLFFASIMAEEEDAK
jgi:hypothetical protein